MPVGDDTKNVEAAAPFLKQDPEDLTNIEVGEVVWQGYKLRPEHFTSHGSWMDGNRMVAQMYRHTPTGTKFFTDCPEARKRNLPIYPFGDARPAKTVLR